MPIVKAYLRYLPSGAPLSVIASNNANCAYISALPDAVAVPALQNVIVWNTRKAIALAILPGERRVEVSCLCAENGGKRLAVGYADGRILLWDVESATAVVTLQGHSTAVTILKFDEENTQLVSGGADGEIVVWDVVSESGLYRLKGHHGAITDVHFLAKYNLLVSSSKDTFVKVWDTVTRFCVQTIVGHRCEVCAIAVLEDGRQIITGAADSDLRIFTMSDGENKTDEVGDTFEKAYKLFGVIKRQSKERCVTLKLHENKQILGVQAADKSIEFFSVRSETEAKKKWQRRQKRIREKSRKHIESGTGAETEAENVVAELDEMKPEDYFGLLHVLRTDHKARSFDFCSATKALSKTLKDGNVVMDLCVATSGNTIELFRVSADAKEATSDRVGVLDSAGHRSDIRCVAISTDSHLICTGGQDGLKVWNAKTHACIRTIESPYVVSVAFVPGNRHIVIGTKTGQLQIYDIAAAELTHSVDDAHKESVWTLHLRPDGNGLVSGSSDKCVHFWDFELVEKKLRVAHVRTLQMEEDVLCVRYSQDQKVLAVALLDATVKVFHADTLKFSLSLYGHKLPVLSMDISSDGTLLVTGSADKNIKIWGLDFGDCHRSLFAHQDSVTCVQFVHDTHYVFTGSKDGNIRYWDADSFEMITTMEGHVSDVWCLAVSKDGRLLASGSRDRSLRLWQRSQEQIFLEEEREKSREDEAERQLALGRGEVERVGAGAQDAAEDEEADPTLGDEAAVGIRNSETLRGTELILDALDVYEHEQERIRTRSSSTANPILVALGNMEPDRYLLHVLQKIRASDLDEALLSLPFSSATQLLEQTVHWLERGWATELALRVSLFLLKAHQSQIVSTRTRLPNLDQLRALARSRAAEQRDLSGFNLAGLNYIKRRLEEQGTHFFNEAINQERENRVKRKRVTLGSA